VLITVGYGQPTGVGECGSVGCLTARHEPIMIVDVHSEVHADMVERVPVVGGSVEEYEVSYPNPLKIRQLGLVSGSRIRPTAS
jgi:hypothetical protein